MKLFEFEMRWAAAAFEAIFPEQTALPHGIARMKPGAFLADVIKASAFEQAMGLRITLWIVALAPFWFSKRPRTIASIDATERQTVIERLIASPIYAVRQLTVAFKAMASLLYSQSTEARLAMTRPRVMLAESGLVQVRRKNTKEQGAANESAA